MMEELPKGWATCDIEGLFHSFSGGTPNKGVASYWNGHIPWLSSGDIKADRISSSTYKITASGLNNSSAWVCRAGSLVVVVRSGILKHTLPVAILDCEAAINQDIKCFDSGNDNLNCWFAMALKASAGSILALNREGTTVQSVKYETLKTFKLPLPPSAEQHRILVKLETLLAITSKCHDRLVGASLTLKRFRRAVLAAACSGHLTSDWREQSPDTPFASVLLDNITKERKTYDLRKINAWEAFRESYLELALPESWAICGFDNLAAPKPYAIKAGPFGSSLTKADYVPSGFKVYGQEQVIRGDSEFGDYYIDGEKFKELQSCEISAGDILISLVGTIGKVLIVPEKFQRGIINPRLAKLSLHRSINREYIALFLRSPLAMEVFSKESHGGTMEILNLGMLRELPIPIPPVQEQSEIVRRVTELFAFADKIEARYKTVQQQVDRLPQSILAKAFRGELVHTEAELAEREGRSYESAEQLLQRIRAAKPETSNTGSRVPTKRRRHAG